jgi:hypothetical protein
MVFRDLRIIGSSPTDRGGLDHVGVGHQRQRTCAGLTRARQLCRSLWRLLADARRSAALRAAGAGRPTVPPGPSSSLAKAAPLPDTWTRKPNAPLVRGPFARSRRRCRGWHHELFHRPLRLIFSASSAAAHDDERSRPCWHDRPDRQSRGGVDLGGRFRPAVHGGDRRRGRIRGFRSCRRVPRHRALHQGKKVISARAAARSPPLRSVSS